MTSEEFKALTPWEQVRTLTGIIPMTKDSEKDNRILISRLSLVCLISRVQAGDAEQSFLDECIDKAFGVTKAA